MLEREHLKQTGTSHSHLLAARALLVRSGLTVSEAAPAGNGPPSAPLPAPPPNEAAGCSYCGMNNHSVQTCWKKKRDIQIQIDAINAASGTPSRPKRSNKPCSSNPSSDGSTSRQDDPPPASTTALMAAAPAPAVQPPPLPAVVPSKTDAFFKKNMVPSGQLLVLVSSFT